MLHGEKFTIRESTLNCSSSPQCVHTHIYTVIPEKHHGYIMQSNTSKVHVHKQPTTAPISITGLISELCYRAAKGSNKMFIYLVQLVDVVTQPQ